MSLLSLQSETNQTVPKALVHLTVAALMGEGELYKTSKEEIGLYVPYDTSKTVYIQNYLLHNSLEPFVTIDIRKGELYIFPYSTIESYFDQWFRGPEKIFSSQLDPGLLTPQSILIWINLFGNRNIDSVVVSTNVSKPYLRNLAYCIEGHLKSQVVIGRKSLKIHDIESLFITTMKYSLNDSTSIATFLTQNELKKLIKMSISILKEGEDLQ